MMQIAALTPKQYDRLKGDLRPYIRSAVYYSDATVTGVEIGIYERTHLPVVYFEGNQPIGMMTLELGEDCVHVTTMAGDFQADWKPKAFEALRAIAIGQDKQAIELKGRKGWQPYLKAYGFEPAGDKLRCEL